jgi:hypothetical protein
MAGGQAGAPQWLCPDAMDVSRDCWLVSWAYGGGSEHVSASARLSWPPTGWVGYKEGKLSRACRGVRELASNVDVDKPWTTRTLEARRRRRRRPRRAL